MNLSQCRKIVDRKKGRIEDLKDEISILEKDIDHAERELSDWQKAQDIIHAVARATQDELKVRITDTTSLGLATVFDNPYNLDVQFEVKRNQTECKIMFERDGNLVSPKKASGVGAVDVAAFCLQIAIWSIGVPKTAPVLIADEIFKHLKGEEANVRALQLVKEMSDTLGIQIIMVSDERAPRERIMEYCDKLIVMGE